MIQFEGDMKQSYITFLSGTFLFLNISISDCTTLLKEIEAECIQFSKGDKVSLCDSIAFLINGECEVVRGLGDHGKLVFNSLKKGESFGIISLFSNEPYVTSIIAKKESKLLLLSKATVDKLIESSPLISKNIINFLVGRVIFLNNKVATLGNMTVEEKCISYIKSEMKDNCTSLKFPMAAVARKLGVGRASLYRALNSLECKGVISREDNAVLIKDKNYFV